MGTKKILLFAGYSSSGKSSLLARCLMNRLPLFGADFDGEFQRIRTHPHLPESTLSFEQTLACDTWFSGFHLRQLQSLPSLPETVVVHVDITELLWNPQRIPYISAESLSLFPRTLESLVRNQDNAQILDDYFRAPIFQRFDSICINTLITPWDVIVRQYRERTQRGLETSRRRDKLFIRTGPGEQLMQAALAAWLNACRTVRGHHLTTHWDGNRIKIDHLHAPAALPSRDTRSQLL